MSFSRFLSGFAVFLFLAVLIAAPAQAYVPYLSTETAVPIERGKSRLDFTFGVEKWDTTPRQTRYIFDNELSYGLINNLEFTVKVPYVVINRSRGGNTSGLGDLTLKTKIRFIKGRAANPVSMSGMLIAKFPSCDESKALTQECTGEPDIGLKAITSKEFFPVTVHLNIGFMAVGNPPNTDFDDIFTYNLALDTLTKVDFLHVVAEFAGETNRDPDESSDPMEMLLGLLYDIAENKFVSLATTFGLSSASPDVGFNVGLQYIF